MSRRRTRRRAAALQRSIAESVVDVPAPDVAAAVEQAAEGLDEAVAEQVVDEGQVLDDDPVDDGPLLLPPPPSWVRRIRELIDRHPGLPPLFAGEPEHALDVDGQLWLHPWRAGYDVGALLDWSSLLEGPVTVRRGPGRGRTADTVSIDGMLAGHPTRLVGHTHRLPTEHRVLMSLELLQAVATREILAAEQTCADDRLTDANLALLRGMAARDGLGDGDQLTISDSPGAPADVPPLVRPSPVPRQPARTSAWFDPPPDDVDATTALPAVG